MGLVLLRPEVMREILDELGNKKKKINVATMRLKMIKISPKEYI